MDQDFEHPAVIANGFLVDEPGGDDRRQQLGDIGRRFGMPEAFPRIPQLALMIELWRSPSSRAQRK
jgi:hypothetical protein